MRTAITHYGTKREFLEAGANAIVTYTQDDGAEVTTTVAGAVPCRVLNAKPVSQVPEVRWDHTEKTSKKEPTQRQLHGKLQPSWSAAATLTKGRGLVIQ